MSKRYVSADVIATWIVCGLALVAICGLIACEELSWNALLFRWGVQSAEQGQAQMSTMMRVLYGLVFAFLVIGAYECGPTIQKWARDWVLSLFEPDKSAELEAETAEFHNYYECPRCGNKWEDIYDAQPDDDCPDCGYRHISPYKSVDLHAHDTIRAEARAAGLEVIELPDGGTVIGSKETLSRIAGVDFTGVGEEPNETPHQS